MSPVVHRRANCSAGLRWVSRADSSRPSEASAIAAARVNQNSAIDSQSRSRQTALARASQRFFAAEPIPESRVGNRDCIDAESHLPGREVLVKLPAATAAVDALWVLASASLIVMTIHRQRREGCAHFGVRRLLLYRRRIKMSDRCAYSIASVPVSIARSKRTLVVWQCVQRTCVRVGIAADVVVHPALKIFSKVTVAAERDGVVRVQVCKCVLDGSFSFGRSALF